MKTCMVFFILLIASTAFANEEKVQGMVCKDGYSTEEAISTLEAALEKDDRGRLVSEVVWIREEGTEGIFKYYSSIPVHVIEYQGDITVTQTNDCMMNGEAGFKACSFIKGIRELDSPLFNY